MLAVELEIHQVEHDGEGRFQVLGLLQFDQDLTFAIVTILPGGFAVHPAAVGEQDLHRNTGFKARLGHSAHGFGDVALVLTIRMAGCYLKTGVVHVGDDGQGIGDWVSAGNFGDDVPEGVLTVL